MEEGRRWEINDLIHKPLFDDDVDSHQPGGFFIRISSLYSEHSKNVDQSPLIWRAFEEVIIAGEPADFLCERGFIQIKLNTLTSKSKDR